MPIANRTRWKTGVYLITNTTNGKVYVGSSTAGITDRIRKHKNLLKNGKHSNPHLQHAWSQYGADAFQFSVLLLCPPEHCTRNEQSFIDRFKSDDHNFGYNIREAGNGAHSVETKLKIGVGNRGKKRTPEQVERLSAAHKGHVATEEHRKNLSEAGKGRVFTIETRAKIAASNTGKTHSVETKEKLAAANRGKRRYRMCRFQ